MSLPTNPPEFYDNNERYQALYDHMKSKHGLTLDVGEMEEIAAICDELPKSYSESRIRDVLEKVERLIERERWYYEEWNPEDDLPHDWPRNSDGSRMNTSDLNKAALTAAREELARTDSERPSR